MMYDYLVVGAGAFRGGVRPRGKPGSPCWSWSSEDHIAGNVYTHNIEASRSHQYKRGHFPYQ